MEKKYPSNQTLKQRIKAAAGDRMHRFTLAGDTVRGACVNGTQLVNEMRLNHELGILETMVLGRVYIGALLMAAGLKGNDRLSIQIDCSGPIRGIAVEANAFGEVRGFLKQTPIPIEKPLDSFDLSPFFGAGLLTVTRYMQNAKQPFSGNVILKYGNIAKDLAYYYVTSEQIPTALNLSLQFDRSGSVVGAGGLMLQTLPNASQETILGLEHLVENLASLGQQFEEGKNPAEIIESVFRKYDPNLLGHIRVEFMCHCSKERLRNLMAMLPIDDLKDIYENGPFPVESRCHNCNTNYRFDREEIQALYGRRYPNN